MENQLTLRNTDEKAYNYSRLLFFSSKYVEPSVNPRLTTVNREEQKSIFVKVCQTKCKDSDKEVSGC